MAFQRRAAIWSDQCEHGSGFRDACMKVVSRFHLGADDRGDPDTEEILLRNPGIAMHNGGQIAFGPDGCLYIAVGDNGYYPDTPAQHPDSLLGKILRIDVESGVNPYR